MVLATTFEPIIIYILTLHTIKYYYLYLKMQISISDPQIHIMDTHFLHTDWIFSLGFAFDLFEVYWTFSEST